MVRYRITTTRGDGEEQTWVLLPDKPSAVMQAEELSNREKTTHVRVYHEESENALEWTREVIRDLLPRSK